MQTAITLFTLTMAALMIPGSKLTDIWGRKRCFVLGLIVYGVGGVLALLSRGLPLLIVGYSLFEGVGSALMIPPIYILVTVTSSVNVVQSSFPDKDQGEISGLSRSVSNLGSSFGTALVGSVMVAVKLPAGKPFAVALTMMLVFTLIGLVLGILIPRHRIETTETSGSAGHDGLVDTTETGPPG